MKVLHICNDFSYTRVHSNLYKVLDEKGIQQIVFNPTRDTTPIGQNNIDFKTKESKIIYSNSMAKYHSFLFRSKINFLYNDLTSKIDINTIDIIHATTLFSDGALALKIKEKYGTPFVVAVRTTDIDVFLKYRPDLIFIVFKIIREASKIFFISDSLRKKFIKHYLIKSNNIEIDLKSNIVYNGIDDFWLNNIFSKKDSKPYKLLYVGRFVSRKNIPKLINAVLHLNKKGYDLELNIIGSNGDDEIHIKELANKNTGVINYLGEIKDNTKLLQNYRENHIFAMPSKGETFGLVYIESLSQGLPILFMKNEAIDGIFNFEVGQVCTSSDKDEIVKSIEGILKNYQNYKLNKIDFNLFRWNNIAEKYLNFYTNICQ